METLAFTVLGRPTGKGRPRHALVRTGERIISRTYTPSATRAAEETFAARAARFAPAEPLTGPLSLTVRYYFQIPTSWPRWKQRAAKYHTAKPDADNCLKLTKDAMNGVFWIDDKQVAIVHVTKLYDAVPRTEVELRALEGTTREDSTHVRIA